MERDRRPDYDVVLNPVQCPDGLGIAMTMHVIRMPQETKVCAQICNG